jgi:hypothetical protein
LLTKDGIIQGKLEIVGDLREMPGVLMLADFDYNVTIQTGRNAEEALIKQQYYPKRKDLISKYTMREICKLVAVDYFLFDFEPPNVCSDIFEI